MANFKYIIILFLLLSTSVFSQSEKVPYLRLVTNGYAVVASPSVDVVLQPMTSSQISLSPHLLIETDLLAEQIQIRYLRHGEVLHRAILLTQRGTEPYVRFKVIKRELLDNAERVTFKMETNVPERVITDTSVMINGQAINMSLGDAYTYTAYQAETLLEGLITISNAAEIAEGKSSLHHRIQPDVGCDLIDEQKHFFALCYASEPGPQSVQFYLEQSPIGHDGEVSYIPMMIEDLKLVFRVGESRYDFSIVETATGYGLSRSN